MLLCFLWGSLPQYATSQFQDVNKRNKREEMTIKIVFSFQFGSLLEVLEFEIRNSNVPNVKKTLDFVRWKNFKLLKTKKALTELKIFSPPIFYGHPNNPKIEKEWLDSPAVSDGDDSGTVLSDLEEHWHGEIEVRARWVAPATIVTGLSKVGWAKVSGGDEDWRIPRVAPTWILVALHLKARSAAQAIVEQCCAQCCSVYSIPLCVQVSIPTSTTWNMKHNNIFHGQT